MNKSYLRANLTTIITALLFAPFHSTHAAPIGAHAITYTPHGNVEVDTQGQHHQHNALNQLTTTQTDDQQTITHYYYSNGLRAGTSNGTQLYVHYYTRHNHQVNSTNHTAWSSHLMGQQAELRRSPTQADIMIRDRQGSIIQSVLPANTQGHDYSAHGLDTLTTDIPTLSLENNPWRYANYPYDNTTGLYYLQARDYNPRHRAFVQADSYAVNDYGLSNAYFYGNNPLNGADPTGHDFHDTMNMVSSVMAGVIGVGMLGGAAFLGSKMMATRSSNIATQKAIMAERPIKIGSGTRTLAITPNGHNPVSLPYLDPPVPMNNKRLMAQRTMRQNELVRNNQTQTHVDLAKLQEEGFGRAELRHNEDTARSALEKSFRDEIPAIKKRTEQRKNREKNEIFTFDQNTLQTRISLLEGFLSERSGLINQYYIHGRRIANSNFQPAYQAYNKTNIIKRKWKGMKIPNLETVPNLPIQPMTLREVNALPTPQ